jgi:ATP-dependent RNA helicase HelY
MTPAIGPSPAERYAASRVRAAHPAVTEFAGQYPFELDDFQVEACRSLEDGSSVLVCAPTGAGKTVVGEFAISLGLAGGQKCYYTTPIKALSNQKYNDLVDRHVTDRVGLLTGDNSINAAAPVVVMTTEVLRNMLYVGSDALTGLGYVVMDEVHYLGDRFRGAVWEEVLIHLPDSVRLVALSATVSNAEEFGAWLVTVRGDTRVIVHEQRPVPLWQHVLVGSRLFDLFKDADPTSATVEGPADVNPELREYLSDRMRAWDVGTRGRVRRRGPGWRPPHRPDVVTRLDREGLLPLITFIFSRVGCDAAVRQCVLAGLWLTEPAERHEITTLVEERTAGIPSEDLEVLGYWEWLDGLRRGVAAHHAGLIPAFKETVEELFVRGLVRAVFATETLALGINMPARCVLLERLTKFNGETHADITPGEYTQLTGRAGRRGSISRACRLVEPRSICSGLPGWPQPGLRCDPRSAVVQHGGQSGRSNGPVGGPRTARRVVRAVQADRGGGLVAQIRRNEKSLDEYGTRMNCDRGDFREYMALRQELSEREAALSRVASRERRGAVAASLEVLRTGDVIRVPAGRRAGLAIVLDPGLTARDDPRPLVLTERRWAGRLSMMDFPVAVESIGSVRVPRHFNHRSPQERRDLAAALRRVAVPPGPSRRKGSPPDADEEVARLRAAVRAHPCHGCPDRDEHARWAERYRRLQRENAGLVRRVAGRTDSLGRTFDQICELLDQRGYLAGDEATPAGRRLARIWSESDLVVAECLRDGVWDGLDPAQLAAVVSPLVYEARRDEPAADRMPSPAVRDALADTLRVWGDVTEDEAELGLPASREPEPGFIWPVYRWARRESLGRALGGSGGRDQRRAVCRRLRPMVQTGPGFAGSDRDRAQRQDSQCPNGRSASRALRRGVVAQGMQP